MNGVVQSVEVRLHDPSIVTIALDGGALPEIGDHVSIVTGATYAERMGSAVRRRRCLPWQHGWRIEDILFIMGRRTRIERCIHCGTRRERVMYGLRPW